MASTQRHWAHGYVMLLDVEGFTLRESPQQLRIVQHLSRQLTEGLERHALKAEDVAINSTGDGFLLVVRHGDRGLGPHEMLNLALHMVETTSLYRADLGEDVLRVRVGLHMDSFQFGVEAFGSDRQVVGAGPNWCSRIADLAGPSQILVSEKIFCDLEDCLGTRKVQGMFAPSDGFFEIRVKHGKIARFKVVKALGLSDDLPPKVRRTTDLSRLLSLQLDSLLQSACEYLTDGQPNPRLLGARATFWEVDHKRGVLVGSPFRRHHDGSASDASRTVYGCAPPQGPLATCVADGKPHVLIDLPPFQQRRDEYIGILEGTGLSIDQILSMGRKSQAFLCIPCAVAAKEPAEMAICLDFNSPLTGMQARANKMVEDVFSSRAPYLATLWRLRNG